MLACQHLSRFHGRAVDGVASRVSNVSEMLADTRNITVMIAAHTQLTTWHFAGAAEEQISQMLRTAAEIAHADKAESGAARLGSTNSN